jgi:hypothetical protein
MNPQSATLFRLSLFAVAMALVEAAIVVHLRTIYYPDDPLKLFPLNLMSHRDLAIELGREAATLVMLWSVARLAEREPGRAFAAFVYLFGLWDLGYYLWLKVFIGWPVAWLEWDVLFLIPWPWLGPWPAPALIALLLVVWGGVVVLRRWPVRFGPLAAACFLSGMGCDLAAFLLPGAPLLADGEEAFRGYTPTGFPWGLYAVGWVLMAVGLALSRGRQPAPAAPAVAEA